MHCLFIDSGVRRKKLKCDTHSHSSKIYYIANNIPNSFKVD